MSEVVGIVYVFFFFQAEDGIRDLTVTGVQTCALPISHEPGARRDRLDLLPLEGLRLWGTTAIGHSTPGMDMNYNHNFEPRSEERRVGKSVDLGGRRIIKKKKQKINGMRKTERYKRPMT